MDTLKESLEKVGFYRSQLSPKILTEISQSLLPCQLIKDLTFSGCDCSLQGAIAVAKLIEYLPNLEYFKMTPLSWNTPLTHLGNRGASLILQALGVHNQIRRITLSGNGLDDAIFPDIALLLQRSGSRLAELDISKNQFTGDGLSLLVPALERNYNFTNLDITLTTIPNVESLAAILQTNKSLISLKVNQGSKMKNEHFTYLSPYINQATSLRQCRVWIQNSNNISLDSFASSFKSNLQDNVVYLSRRGFELDQQIALSQLFRVSRLLQFFHQQLAFELRMLILDYLICSDFWFRSPKDKRLVLNMLSDESCLGRYHTRIERYVDKRGRSSSTLKPVSFSPESLVLISFALFNDKQYNNQSLSI